MDNNPEQPANQPAPEAVQPVSAPEQSVAEQPVAEQPAAEQPVAEATPVQEPAAAPVQEPAAAPLQEPAAAPVAAAGPAPVAEAAPSAEPVGTVGMVSSAEAAPVTEPAPESAPKQPMSPETKKKIILGCSIGGAVLILGIVAAIVIPMLLTVHYKETYTVAKELKPKIYEIDHNYDCSYVVEYVDSAYTSPKAYGDYVASCKKAYQDGVDELVAKLGNTEGIKKNNDLKLQYDKFKAKYASLSTGSSEEFSAKLALWEAVHNFNYAVDKLSTDSSDAQCKVAADYLIESGNDTLKAYGEGWLEHALELTAAYRAYQASSWQTSSEYYTIYTNKRNEFNNWRSTNAPTMSSIAPLDFDDTTEMYNEFTTLYNLIAKTYQDNYDYGSGVCFEFMGVVSCE